MIVLMRVASSNVGERMKWIGFPKEFIGEIYTKQTASSCEVVFDNGHLSGTIVYPEVDQVERDRLEKVLNETIKLLVEKIESGQGIAIFEDLMDYERSTIR